MPRSIILSKEYFSVWILFINKIVDALVGNK